MGDHDHQHTELCQHNASRASHVRTIIGVVVGLVLGFLLTHYVLPHTSIQPTDTDHAQENATLPESESREGGGGESTTASSATTTTTGTSTCPDSGACNADAKTYCADEWSGTNIQASWKLDLVRCLYDDHKDDISDTCRESLECRQVLNESLVTSCKDDQQKFCTGVTPKPGSEPLVDCLEAHFSDLSPACQAAWTAHDEAKPTK